MITVSKISEAVAYPRRALPTTLTTSHESASKTPLAFRFSSSLAHPAPALGSIRKYSESSSSKRL
ncbi:hypothetical protein C8Q78DRAFT_150939 [Trametes maxima]|nr:hypothetical protein C8Q78DRAFT_150939 [Trametes maxima]